MNTLGKFIRLARKEKGLSLRELAARCGLSHSYVDNLEKGVDPRSGKAVSPTLDTILKLAAGLGMTFGELLYRSGMVDDENIKPYQFLGESFSEYITGKTIPLLGTIKTGTALLAEENWEGELNIPADIQAEFAIRVKDGSMIGVGIFEGDYVLCQQTQSAEPGDIIVTLKRGNGSFFDTVLVYYLHTDQGPLLRAANACIPDMPVGIDFCMCGVMVALLRKQPPPYTYYTDHLSQKGNFEEWSQVFESAVQYGLKPDMIKFLIKNQWEVAERLWGKKPGD